jgi:hypothetical protein
MCGVLAAASLGAAPSAAAIKCTADGYQVVQGQLLSTPFCQDNLIGKVARQYGVKVSDAEIRNNPNKKAEVCRFVGADIRIKSACQGYADEQRGRF